MANKKIGKPESTALSPMRIPIAGPNESLQIVSRDSLREGVAVVTTTSTLESAVRMLDVERNLLKMYLPTRDRIARECWAIRKKWSPAERARRWRGRSTHLRYE